MTVRVRSKGTAGGGQSDITLFEDTMLAPDQPFLIGTNWQWCWDPNTAQAETGQQMANSFNRVAGGLQTTNTTGGGTVPKGFGLPRPLSWAQLISSSQFAEYVFVSDNSVGGSVSRMGPMVLCDPNIGNCYYLDLIVETGPFQINIERWSNAAGTVIATASPNQFAANDRMTLTADITPSTVNLAVLRNGISILTVSDNTFRTGLPGFHVDGISNGIAQVFRTFRCGKLSRLNG